ncbi:hypothetical protein BAUCODRAFT_145613 [Baudoinia panamericana UAMH 10762]|uniref:Uncharacterized protein n=1 Tax=Baudoinia panamericana (strain UAMH 10762) TaxID=717646 RepID=M2N869_BAUPA|nr:uncharacterized protein BAUCODRAFT_145613 [Baudoinia panamericana UAMH 10762]EMD00329.1 hypothetical protein BAUCODRAFT_145613 [Baudoinia panamericana UAMH 10762]
MDELAIAAKARHRVSKAPKAIVPETALQQQLQMNPYARALATDVRQCQITGARLPRHFLLPVTTRLLPLSGDEDSAKRTPKATLDIGVEIDRSFDDQTKWRGHTYLLARQSVLHDLKRKKKWPQLSTERTHRWLASKLGVQAHAIDARKHYAWDERAPEFTFDKLRSRVFSLLDALLVQHPDLVIPVPHQMIGNDPSREEWSCLIALQAGPTLTNTTIPIFDGHDILDPDAVPETCQQVPQLAGARYVAVKKHAKTVRLQLALLKLEGYLRNQQQPG